MAAKTWRDLYPAPATVPPTAPPLAPTPAPMPAPVSAPLLPPPSEELTSVMELNSLIGLTEELDSDRSAPPEPTVVLTPRTGAGPRPRREPGRADTRRGLLGARHRPLVHRDVSGGWLRPAVFGAMDGLVTNASLIAGVGGGGAANHTIVLTGLAGLIAGAFSMATGEYISVCSQNELTEAEVQVEQLQHWRNPEGEERELAEAYVKRGVAPDLAEAVAQQISVDPKEAVKVHIREELGIDPDDLPSPWTAAGASFASFTVGALLPLLPYLFGAPAAFVMALVLAAVASFAGGASVAQLTGRPPLRGGLRQFGLGALATGMTFLTGLLVGAHVS